VSESDSILARTASNSSTRPGADELLPPPNARVIPEREGLPRSYRMRADAHYVDDLPPAAQPVIRMLAPAQIECRDIPAADVVESLTRSIAAVGMLQPLLIRRTGGRYTLISGRKRLAAALAASLAAVPCVLHDVDGPAAVALAAADNLRVESASAPMPAEDREPVRPVVQALLADLATIRTSTSLMKATRHGSLTQQVGADLVDAHARHAEWLARCAAGASDAGRHVPLAAVIQRVSDGFDAQKTLAGLQLEWSVTPAAAVWNVPDEQAAAVLTGAVFAAMALLEGTAYPRVEVHADAPQPRTLRLEVVQRTARLLPSAFGGDLDGGRPAEMIPALALRLARTLAAAHGGTAELSPLPGQGSVLSITLMA
jgi:ParB/RepB/Spo0J family partition protein